MEQNEKKAATAIRKVDIDIEYVKSTLLDLLAIPSPSGFTDEAVRYTCQQLEEFGLHYEITRRGCIRADMKGRIYSPDRAIVAHLDTIGAMVRELKDNGRLALIPVGTWSSRFAEGARVTIFSHGVQYRGTILPVKASGHAFDKEVDTLPVSWENIELRVDEQAFSKADLVKLDINVGDYVSVDPQPDISASGFINSRHLDDKAGVAVLLAVAKATCEYKLNLPLDCHLLFTISEEVGSGASAVLHQDVAEMVSIDTGPVAPGQSTDEFGVTIGMQDSSGPFDYHLTHKLIKLCQEHGINHKRDVFKYYRSDSASALEAGNDIRTALLCFGADATHGYERCHIRSLQALGQLLCCYIQSAPTSKHDQYELGPLTGFSHLPVGSTPADSES